MKQVKSIDDVYGKYATPSLVEGLMNTAKENITAIKLRRHDLVSKDTCDNKVESCCEDLDFWEAIIEACRRWNNGT